jgi:predicted kinase
LLVGLPGSGKSTYAASQGWRVLSSDGLRELLLDDVTDQSANIAVFRTLRSLLVTRLKLRRPVTCIDATNLTRKERRPYVVLAGMYGADAEAVFLDVAAGVCRERNRARQRNVPEEIMDRMAAKLQPPVEAEGFTRVSVVR